MDDLTNPKPIYDGGGQFPISPPLALSGALDETKGAGKPERLPEKKQLFHPVLLYDELVCLRR